MDDLFKPLTRTERQKLAIKTWAKAGGVGTIVMPTGCGKTRVGTDIIESLLKKRPSLRVIVLVPTQALQEQWITTTNDLGFSLNVEVIVMNTAIRHKYQCDLLIIDKCLSM